MESEGGAPMFSAFYLSTCFRMNSAYCFTLRICTRSRLSESGMDDFLKELRTKPSHPSSRAAPVARSLHHTLISLTFLRSCLRLRRHFVPIGFYPADERKWCEFLGCPATKEGIAAKIATWNALDLETECNARGMVGGMVRTIEEWAATECGQQLAETPVIEITKIGDSRPEPFLPGAKRPLSGLRVVCNTHEIGGTAIGRTLAEQGAEAIQTSSPTSISTIQSFLRPPLACARPMWISRTLLSSR